MRLPKVNDLVAVAWVDSCSPIDGPWHQQDTVTNDLPLIYTLGAVFAVDETAITVVQSFGDDDESQVSGVMTIPVVSIQTMFALEPA